MPEEMTCAVGDSMDDGLQFGRILSSPNVIFGSGNEDGQFSKSTANGIELGLRGKLRYNEGCLAENTFNRIANAGYNFPKGNPAACSGMDDNRPTWSYEFSINSDVGCDVAGGDACTPLDAYDYHIQLDDDRSYCTDFNWAPAGTYDVINDFLPNAKPDHALGTESTLQATDDNMDSTYDCQDDSGTWTCPSNRCNVASDGFPFSGCLGDTMMTTYEDGIGSLTVAQNSYQLQFFQAPNFNFELPGIYTFKLAAKCKGTDLVIAETYIDILVGDLATEFPTQASDCDVAFSFGGLFASEEECKDFVSRYAA